MYFNTGHFAIPNPDHYDFTNIMFSGKLLHDETNLVHVFRNITAMDKNKFQNDLDIFFLPYAMTLLTRL